MTSRFEKEKQKAQQEKFQAVLSGLLKDDDNKYCVDCDAKGPRWASWNLGIFLCIRCAGIHRNLGVHISKVKSVNLDTWTAEQVAMVMEVGNSRARAAYEANLPDNYRRPQTDSALESFIRAKYESKKYLAKEWVPPRPAVPRELLEDEKDKKKPKSKVSSGNVQINAVPRSQSGSTVTESSKPASKPAAESKPVQQAKVATPQQPKARPTVTANSNTADLIGLDAPVSPVHNNSSNLLSDLDDFMGAGSNPAAPGQQPNVQNSTNQVSNGDLNLFGESAGGSEADKGGEKVSTKDSIMALFGGGQQTQQQQFGVPADNYMAQCEGVGGVTCPTNYITQPCDFTGLHTFAADTGGMYMPQQQQQQQQPQQPPQQQQLQQQPQNVAGAQMYGMQMNNMQMQQQQGMYGNQMGMMGMAPQQQPGGGAMGMPGMAGMQQQPQGGGAAAMGMQPQQQPGQQQAGMRGMGAQGQMAGMYGAQPQQMQQAQYQQMQQQMTNMSLGQAGQFGGAGAGMMTNGIPAGQGWSGGQASGQTLSTNLWQ